MAGLDKTKSEVTNAGGSCQTFLGDVSRREHVQCAVDGAISHFNMSPSIGINCAGKKNYLQFNCILLCIEHIMIMIPFYQLGYKEVRPSYCKGLLFNSIL